MPRLLELRGSDRNGPSPFARASSSMAQMSRQALRHGDGSTTPASGGSLKKGPLWVGTQAAPLGLSSIRLSRIRSRGNGSLPDAKDSVRREMDAL
jgi:hypothetical protein